MIGMIAGDIIGSPYDKYNTEDEFFDILSPNYIDTVKASFPVDPQMTENSVMALAVMKWLTKFPEHDSASLADTIEETFASYPNIQPSAGLKKWLSEDVKDGESHRVVIEDDCSVIARCAPIALYCKSLSEALELTDTALGITGASEDDRKAARAYVAAVHLFSQGKEAGEVVSALESDFGVVLWDNNNPRLSSYYYIEEDGLKHKKIQHDRPMRIVQAALRSVIDTRSFEGALRRGVTYGGRSAVVAGAASALAEARYQQVPGKIASRIEPFFKAGELNSIKYFELKAGKDKEENLVRKEVHKVFVLERCFGDKTYYIDAGQSAIRAAILKVNPDAEIKSYAELAGDRQAAEKEYFELQKDMPCVGAWESHGRKPNIRTLYCYQGQLGTVTTTRAPEVKTPLDVRKKHREEFERLKQAAMGVVGELENAIGYSGEDTGHLNFETAYYIPCDEILKDSVTVREGNFCAGVIRINPFTGLIDVDNSAEYTIGEKNDGEWCRARVFESVPTERVFVDDVVNKGKEHRPKSVAQEVEEARRGERAYMDDNVKSGFGLGEIKIYKFGPSIQVNKAIEALRAFILDDCMDDELQERLHGRINMDTINDNLSRTQDPRVCQHYGWKPLEFSDGVHVNKEVGMDVEKEENRFKTLGKTR